MYECVRASALYREERGTVLMSGYEHDLKVIVCSCCELLHPLFSFVRAMERVERLIEMLQVTASADFYS